MSVVKSVLINLLHSVTKAIAHFHALFISYWSRVHTIFKVGIPFALGQTTNVVCRIGMYKKLLLLFNCLFLIK